MTAAASALLMLRACNIMTLAKKAALFQHSGGVMAFYF